MSDNQIKTNSLDDIKRYCQKRYQISTDYRADYDADWSMLYKMYYAYVDLDTIDITKMYAFVPLTFNAVETTFVRLFKALFGSSPIFPFRAKDKTLNWNRAASALTDLADDQADSAGIYEVGSKTIKQDVLFGCGDIEAWWNAQAVKKQVRKPVIEKGYVVDYEDTDDIEIEQGLMYRNVAPWMTLIDPATANIQKMAWDGEIIPCRKSVIKKFLQSYSYAIKPDELMNSQRISQDWQQLRKDMGYAVNDDDDDMGFVVRFRLSEDKRIVELWNGEQVIRNEKNAFRQRNRAHFINIDDPYPNCYYAHTETKPGALLNLLINDLFSILLNNYVQTTDPAIAFDSNVVSADKIITTGNAKIELNGSKMMGRSINDVLQKIDIGKLDSNSFNIVEMMKKLNDDTYSQSAYMQGTTPVRKEQATVVRTLKEAGEAIIDVKIRNAEMMGLKHLALLSYDLIRDNCTEEIARTSLGDRAEEFLGGFKHPDEFPGGYQWRFVGSDLMTEADDKFQRQVIDFQTFKDAIGTDTPPGKMAAAILRRSRDFEETDVRDFTEVKPPEMAPQQPGQGGGDQIAQASNNPNALAPQAGRLPKMSEVAA